MFLWVVLSGSLLACSAWRHRVPSSRTLTGSTWVSRHRRTSLSSSLSPSLSSLVDPTAPSLPLHSLSLPVNEEVSSNAPPDDKDTGKEIEGEGQEELDDFTKTDLEAMLKTLSLASFSNPGDLNETYYPQREPWEAFFAAKARGKAHYEMPYRTFVQYPLLREWSDCGRINRKTIRFMWKGAYGELSTPINEEEGFDLLNMLCDCEDLEEIQQVREWFRDLTRKREKSTVLTTNSTTESETQSELCIEDYLRTEEASALFEDDVATREDVESMWRRAARCDDSESLPPLSEEQFVNYNRFLLMFIDGEKFW